VGLGNDSHPFTLIGTLECGELDTPNKRYPLGKNISIDGLTCLNMTAQNITISCNGFTIQGDNSSTTYGVYTNQFNSTVANCTILNFSSGIFISVVEATESRFYNNTINITYVDGYGVYAE